MAVKPPILDARALGDLLAQLQAQAKLDVPQWSPPPEGDAGTMLQRIFARLTEIAIERLNRLPEKNLLAFLDAMGVSPLSPTAAKVPLTFSLLKNTPPTVIPKGTQAGNKPSGTAPNLTFETTEDFTVIPAQLAHAFTMDPVWDRFTDQTAAVAGKGSVAFTPFVGTERMPHFLYFGNDALLTFSHPAKATLSFAWPSAPSNAIVQQFLHALVYQYITQGDVTSPDAVSVGFIGGRIVLTLSLPNSVDLSAVQGPGVSLESSRWLQAILTVPFRDTPAANAFRMQNALLSVSNAASFLPDAAFTDNSPVDLTKGFLPFGDTPAVGSTFYIGSQDAFSKPGSNVTLNFDVASIDPPVLLWEYWNSTQWVQLPAANVIDDTHGFTDDGLISLTVPANIPSGGPTGGIAAYGYIWARARLVSGGYRGAPSIPSFNLVTSAKLASASAANATAITIDTSDLATAGGGIAQFVGQGQPIQVEGDYAIVSSVNGATINLATSLPNAHGIGAAVNVLIATHVGTASQAIAQGATQITSSTAVANNSVVLINDNWNPEFVIVNSASQAPDNVNAVLALRSACAKGHAQGTSLTILSVMDLGGLAADSWVDFTKEFYPLGTTPGPADTFFMYTFPGTQVTNNPIFIIGGLAGGGFVAAEHTAVTARDTAAATRTSVASGAVDRATIDTGATSLAGTAARESVAGTAATDSAAGGAATGGSRTLASSESFRSQAQRASSFQFAQQVITGVNLGQFFFFFNTISPQMCINVKVTLKKNLPPVVINWEFLDSNGWHPLTVTDDSERFMSDGSSSVVLQGGQCELATVNNQKNYWVRARISSGNYGNPVTYIPVDPTDSSKGYKVQPGSGNVHAPILSNFSLDYSTTPVAPLLVTQNGFTLADVTSSNSTGFAPFVPTTDLTPISNADPEPAFYLGFDAAFPQQPVKLYIDAAPRSFAGSVLRETSLAPSLLAELPALRWEYFNGTAWSSLSVLDETSDLTEPGAIEFLTPADVQPLGRFDGTPRYWIRALSSRNDPFDTQQLGGVYLNTTAAVQSLTIKKELLGSSNGARSQSFRFSRSPVLSGQQLQVREAEQPSGPEAAALLVEEGSDAVEQRINSVTQQVEFWVRWHEVENFLASAPYSRHYTLDHATGFVNFGDGQHGMVPPASTQNIAASYQAGGGAAGNVAAGEVAQIKSKVAGAAAVINPVASDAGSDVEALVLVEERGPQVLRHRGRAIAAKDMEWLAREAAGTRVARTMCLPNVNTDLVFEPGWVTLLIVPQSTDVKPTPSSALLHEVEDYLAGCSYVGLSQHAPARINVIGPGYVGVVVAAEVVPENVNEAQSVKQAALQALEAYLHPLTGGTTGTGWDFGQPLYASKINQLLENVPGVDHVAALQLQPNLAQYRLAFDANSTASTILAEGTRVITPDGRKSALMAEANAPLSNRLFVKTFKEADRIAKVVDLSVTSVSATQVQVTAADNAPFVSDSLGMPRGSVVRKFDGSASTRLAVGWLPGDQVSGILLETAMSLNVGDRLTVFYPFPMDVVTVEPDSLKLTVTAASLGNVIDVAPFLPDVDVPRGTTLTSPDGTRMTTVLNGLPASQTVTQLAVADASFAASLIPGDAVQLLLPTLSLRIAPYEPELPLPAGSLIATLDNRVRLPLLLDVPSGQTSTAIRLQSFASGDRVVSFDSASGQSFSIQTVQPVYDVVDLDPNFLIYSGPHQITMVEE